MVGKGAGTIVNALIGDAAVEIWKVLFSVYKKIEWGYRMCLQFKL